MFWRERPEPGLQLARGRRSIVGPIARPLAAAVNRGQDAVDGSGELGQLPPEAAVTLGAGRCLVVAVARLVESKLWLGGLGVGRRKAVKAAHL
jgi:hypothetical protein